MSRYLAAPAYVLGLMACIFVPLWWQPYTGPAPPWLSWGKPAVAVAKAARIPPAPPIAEIPPKIETRLVKLEAIKTAMNVIPSSCVRLAAREGEALPMTKKQAREAEIKIDRMARKGDALAKECQRHMRGPA